MVVPASDIDDLHRSLGVWGSELAAWGDNTKLSRGTIVGEATPAHTQ